MIQYPNKTFVAEYDRQVEFLGRIEKTVIVAAKDEDTAKAYLIDKIGSAPDKLIWLMDCNYKTIYDQKGQNPVEPQAAILWNKNHRC